MAKENASHQFAAFECAGISVLRQARDKRNIRNEDVNLANWECNRRHSQSQLRTNGLLHRRDLPKSDRIGEVLISDRLLSRPINFHFPRIKGVI